MCTIVNSDTSQNIVVKWCKHLRRFQDSKIKHSLALRYAHVFCPFVIFVCDFYEDSLIFTGYNFMLLCAHCFHLLQNICRIFGFRQEHTPIYDLHGSNTYQFYTKDDVKHLLRTQFWIIDVSITSRKALRSVKVTTSSLVFSIINQCTGVPDCSFNHPEVYDYSIGSQLPVIRPSDGSINSRLYSHVLKVFDTCCTKLFFN